MDKLHDFGKALSSPSPELETSRTDNYITETSHVCDLDIIENHINPLPHNPDF